MLFLRAATLSVWEGVHSNAPESVALESVGYLVREEATHLDSPCPSFLGRESTLFIYSFINSLKTFFFFFFFLGPYLWHVEVPRLRDKLELQQRGI